MSEYHDEASYARHLYRLRRREGWTSLRAWIYIQLGLAIDRAKRADAAGPEVIDALNRAESMRLNMGDGYGEPAPAHAAFLAHLATASLEVASWPAWKRSILAA